MGDAREAVLGVCIGLFEHDAGNAAAQRMEKIILYVIEHGEVKESGTHDELIRTKGKYFELYKLQSESLKSVGLD